MPNGLIMRLRDSHSLVTKLATATAIAGMLKVAGVSLAFIFFVVIARATTPNDFGIFSAAFSLATILSYFANIGQHVAVLRFAPTLEERYGSGVASRAIARGFVLVLIGSSITAAVVILLGMGAPVVEVFDGSQASFFWTGLFVFAAAMAEYAASALRAQRSLVFALVPRDIGWRLVVVITVLICTPPLTSDFVLKIVAGSLALVCAPQMATLIWRVWRHRRARLPSAESGEMSRATIGLWASSSITPVIEHLTTVLIAIVIGPAAAGAFFAADRLAKLLSFALIASEQLAGPEMARSFHGGRLNEVRLIAATTSAIALAAAIIGAIAYLLIGRFALGLFDPSYVNNYSILMILVAGQLVNGACGSNAILLNMAGRDRDMLAIRVVWGVISLGLVYWAATYFGLMGAAIASTVILVGWNITAVVVCKARLDVWTFFSGFGLTRAGPVGSG